MIKFNKISQSVAKNAKVFVRDMGKADALLPIILLEAAVTGGRTFHAYKRDGFVEARERFTEETLGAIFWFCGIDFFRSLGDKLGKSVFKLPEYGFDTGEDAIRKPMGNFIMKMKKTAGNVVKDSDKFEKALSKFAFGKVMASVVLANLVVGFVVPKINQKITKKYLSGKNKEDQALLHEYVSFNDFIEKTKKSNNPAFKGGVTLRNLLSFSYKIENNSTYKLLATDIGVAGGRGISARNKHERIECLFRDLSSIYFYMFCRGHINSVLNFLQDGNKEGIHSFKALFKELKKGRIDPVSVDVFNEHIISKMNPEGISLEEFKVKLLGDEKLVPEMFADDKNYKSIMLDEFINKVKELKLENSDSIIETAKKMAKLQPELPEGAVLSKSQIEDIFKKGLIDEPEFLDKIYTSYYKKGKSIFAKIFNKEAPEEISKHLCDTTFISQEDLLKLKQNVSEYIEILYKKAKSSQKEFIDADFLVKMAKQNFWKNAFNLGIGFVISGYFLSTAIPKIQYWITKKTTGQDKFPGVQKYND
ncbi:MAG TPA: hypothetical protein PKI94_04030 [Candidatus Gastranaerophilaceae bacterium]|nr:hypothetical protein [Candidatus Gastranaerophilaceae bacterium]